MKEKNKYGQYMTTEFIANFMSSLVHHDKASACLEPSCGNAIFIKSLKNLGFKKIDGIEYDSELIKNNSNVINKSFVSCNFKNKYDVVIGNPPYIRWKNLEPELKDELKSDNMWNNFCNSLCDYSSIFIIKSIEALKDSGELIFITSDYWFSTTHAQKIRNYIIENGYIDSIYHFNETPVFENVKASFVIFKFVKDTANHSKIHVKKYFSKKKLDEETLNSIKDGTNKNMTEFEIPQFLKDEKWILIPEFINNRINKYEKACNNCTIGQICDIGNGMVSGLDKAFLIPPDSLMNDNESKNILKVIKAKYLESFNFTSYSKYIFLNNVDNELNLKCKFENFYEILSNYKDSLLKRYNYGKDLKYWNWAFLRNFSLFSNKKPRIFCPCKERITNKDRFRFSIIPSEYYPTQDVTALFLKDGVQECIEYVTALLNSKYVFEWLSNKGIRKGDIVEFSEKPLSSIPYRKIDFSNNKEKNIHDKIVKLVQDYKKRKDLKILDNIDLCIEKLIKASL